METACIYFCNAQSTAYNTFQFEKFFWIWWKVLDTIILWQDVGPCCEQAHAAFEVGLSLDQGQGVYSGWSDVVVSSQLRLCHTCIIDVMRRLFVQKASNKEPIKILNYWRFVLGILGQPVKTLLADLMPEV